MKSRLFILMALIAILASACAGDGGVDDVVAIEDQVPVTASGDEDNAFYADDSANTNPPSESYAIRQITLSLARDIAGSFATAVLPIYAHHREDIEKTGVIQNGCAMNPYSWKKDHMRINFGPPSTKWCMSVTFSNPRYTDDTELVYGDPHLVESPDQNIPDAAFRIDNRNSEKEALQTISKSFEVEQSVESSMSSTMTFDVTIGTETSVGGEYAGASFEQSLSTEFHTGFEESKERTTAESKTRTDEFDTEYEVGEGRDVMFTFSNAPLTTTVDYSVDGYYDFDIKISGNNAANWWWNNTRFNGGRYGSYTPDDQWNLDSRYNFYNRCFATDKNPGWKDRNQSANEGWFSISFTGLKDYADMFRGVHVDWPRFGDHDCSMELGETSYEGMWPGVGDWLDDILNPDRTKIVLTGTQTRSSASSTTLTITDLTGCTEDEAKAAADRAEKDTNSDDVFTEDVKDCSTEVDKRKSAPATGGNDG